MSCYPFSLVFKRKPKEKPPFRNKDAPYKLQADDQAAPIEAITAIRSAASHSLGASVRSAERPN